MAQYHVAIPITAALAMIQAGDNYFREKPDWHMERMTKLYAKGAKHYSLCPNINKDGLCGCREKERESDTINV